MARRIRVLKRIIGDVAIPIKRLGIERLGDNRVRGDESSDERIIEARVVVVSYLKIISS